MCNAIVANGLSSTKFLPVKFGTLLFYWTEFLFDLAVFPNIFKNFLKNRYSKMACKSQNEVLERYIFYIILQKKTLIYLIYWIICGFLTLVSPILHLIHGMFLMQMWVMSFLSPKLFLDPHYVPFSSF